MRRSLSSIKTAVCGAPKPRERNSSVDHTVEESTAATSKVSSETGRIKKVNQYNLHTMLGQGAYGQVYQATDDKGETVAVKVINKSLLKRRRMGVGGGGGGSALDTIAKEIAVMKKVNHPHCVQLFEVIDDPKTERIFLVMELLTGGEALHKDNLPAGQDHLPEPAARQVFRDLLLGLEYLHAQGIVHRDIKPENLVFSARPEHTRSRSSSVGSSGGGGGGGGGGKLIIPAALLRGGTRLRDSFTSPRNSISGLSTAATPCDGESARDNGSSRRSSRRSSAAEQPMSRSSFSAGGSSTFSSALRPWRRKASAGSIDTSAVAHAHQSGGAALTAAVETGDVVLESGAGPESDAQPPRRSSSALGWMRRSSTKSLGTAEDASAMRFGPPIKILDFGVASICSEIARNDGESRADDSLVRTIGTPAFYAPEMCVKGAYHGRAADIWASGVTLCMLAGGKLPFEADNMPDTFELIKTAEPALPAHASAPLRALLRRMLAKRPEARPSLAELRVDPWVTDGGKLPLPRQESLDVVPTEDEIRDAVKELGVGIKVVLAAKKWKAAALANRLALSVGTHEDEGLVATARNEGN